MKKLEVPELHSPFNDLFPNLPKGAPACYEIGMLGNCGNKCPIYLSGNCEVEEEIEVLK